MSKPPVVHVWPVDAGAFRVLVHVETTDGIPRCVGLDVRGYRGEPGDVKPVQGAAPTEVTTVGLRGLSVPRLLAQAVADLSLVVTQLDAAGLEGVRQALAQSPGRRYDAAHFEEVARIYSENVDHAPTRAVEAHFKISRTAAAKQVARCRELGLLGPTRQGRAGGGKQVKR